MQIARNEIVQIARKREGDKCEIVSIARSEIVQTARIQESVSNEITTFVWRDSILNIAIQIS